MSTNKVQTVVEYLEHLTAGNLAQAHELIHDDITVHPVGKPVWKSGKAHVVAASEEANQVLKTETEIIEAQEIDGKVVVVGKSKFHVKSGARHDDNFVTLAKSHGANEALFKAIYEFNGTKISNVTIESDPSATSYSATL